MATKRSPGYRGEGSNRRYAIGGGRQQQAVGPDIGRVGQAGHRDDNLVPGSDRHRDDQTERTRLDVGGAEAGASRGRRLGREVGNRGRIIRALRGRQEGTRRRAQLYGARAGRQSARRWSREPNGVRHPVRAGRLVR